MRSGERRQAQPQDVGRPPHDLTQALQQPDGQGGEGCLQERRVPSI